MAIITLDFETYYDKDYSLSKMSEVDYILSPRFQTIMATVKVDAQPAEVFIGHDAVARRLASFDWSKVALLAHNTRFDGSILAWRYGYTPALYLDTLSMSRATVHAVTGRSSLKALSDYLGLPPKGDEVVRAIGKRLEDFSPSELQAYADYCVRDTENCYEAFQILRRCFKASELRLIDIVLRMFIQPQVRLDPNVLAEHLNQVRAEKAQIMGQVAHIDPSVFSSNQKFAALLEERGVEVPRKLSPTTGLETFALAKNDRAFKELCMDETQPLEVQALLAARVNAKSTIEETRTQRMLDLSLREWPSVPAARREAEGTPTKTGWAPVPLKYSGARTHRLAGDGGMNWQNFKRGSKIRQAITAPDGHRIVHRDASQIEARMVAWLAGCRSLIDRFASGEDVYCWFASMVYGRPVTKADSDLRFVGGKVPVLQLGYGSGWEKFRHTLFIGNGGKSVVIDEKEAKRIVYFYRRVLPEIPELWHSCEMLLLNIVSRRRSINPLAPARPHEFMQNRVPVVEPGFDALWLPNGLCISYPNIRLDPVERQIVYDGYYKEPTKIYGAKCLENISQALSRIVVTDIAVRMFNKTGRHPFLSTHDSLDYCVPRDEVEWCDSELEKEFAVRPDWASDLPLASEGGWGPHLLAAENDKHPEHKT